MAKALITGITGQDGSYLAAAPVSPALIDLRPLTQPV
jgi:GDP-D-mannose dehydratase